LRAVSAACAAVVFAAPSYLGKYGRPETPGDLKHHACVLRTAAQIPQRWTFHVNGKQETVDVGGSLSSTGAAACNEAVALGLGIGTAPLWQIKPLLETGRIQLLLTEYEVEPTAVHAVWPAAPVLATRTRTFIDFLSMRLALEA
jgi:DNA-binding transcriptional LysR family regulator